MVEDRVGGACRAVERLAVRLGSELNSRNEGYDRPVVAGSGCETVPHVALAHDDANRHLVGVTVGSRGNANAVVGVTS